MINLGWISIDKFNEVNKTVDELEKFEYEEKENT